MNNLSAPQQIILVGPMGAGKTTIGSKLAEQLLMEFIDSDREIEKKTGVTIPLIFDLEGEAGFRERETSVISELTQKKGIVLATGGGAVLSEQNRQLISSRGLVIYLRAPLDQLLERTAKDKKRPLLQTADPRKTLGDILEIREPLYHAVADITYDTNSHSIKDIVSELVTTLIPSFNKTTNP